MVCLLILGLWWVGCEEEPTELEWVKGEGVLDLGYQGSPNEPAEPNNFDGWVEAWTGLAEATGDLIEAILEADKIIAESNKPIVEDVFCDVCGESLTEYNFDGSRETMIGMNFVIYGNHKEGRRVKKVFGKDEINICFVCYLKALGVKPILE